MILDMNIILLWMKYLNKNSIFHKFKSQAGNNVRKVYCYVEKEEKPEEIDHSGDIVKDLSSLNISDIKNRSFFFIGGEIIENPYYEPSEYIFDGKDPKKQMHHTNGLLQY